MIEQPPLLTIRRDFPRPAEELIAALENVPASHVVDALGGFGGLDHRIRPLVPEGCMMVGTAVTCRAGPGDQLALFAALDLTRAGDVIVASAEGFSGAAITGDLILGMARNRGVVGLVTDGMIRDVAGIRSIGLPVYCAGINVNSPARSGPGTAGLPVILGGAQIDSGDVVVADEDGVVIIPQKEIENVIGRLDKIRLAENEFEKSVREGLLIPEFLKEFLDSARSI